jgi:hypothetical protein
MPAESITRYHDADLRGMTPNDNWFENEQLARFLSSDCALLHPLTAISCRKTL